MSSSRFKVIENKRPDAKNLVIVVNKAGQVSADTELLQNLLTNNEEISTGISILRETSPTPSIEEEVSKLESSLEDFLDDDDNDDEIMSGSQRATGKIPHATLRMETYICSSEARRFANDVLHLGGVDPASLLKPIDFEFRRRVVQNDHCYTNLTYESAKQKLPMKSTTNAKHSTTESSKSAGNQSKAASTKSVQSKDKEKVQSDSEDSDNDEEKQDEEQSDEEISYSESDDEDDMDFNVNDRFGRHKGKRKRKYRKHKQKQSTFKDFLETGEISLPEEEHKRKYGKKQKKSIGSTPKQQQTMVNTSKLSQEHSTLKKEKTIKKAPVQSSSKDLSTLSFSVLEKSELDANFGMPTKIVKMENSEKPKHLTAFLTAPKNSQVQAQEKEKERIVESIAKDLESSCPASFPETMREEKPKEKIHSLTEKISPGDLESLKELVDSADEEIGDAIFAVLGENALDELLKEGDLIDFESPQLNQQTNLEDALAKPEVNLTLALTQAIPKQQHPSSVSSVNPPVTVHTLTTTAAVNQSTVKMVRNGRVIILPPIEKPATRGSKRKSVSDATNAVEALPLSDQSAVILSTVAVPQSKLIKSEKSPVKENSGDSKNSSRRSSLNRSDSGRSRNSISGVIEDDTDDLVSDASGASEDDPERLWCICKQPHNNRFMICCDKCEEWFHGKCVNVSKSMGKVIEQSKKEWICPKCRSSGTVSGDKKLNQSKLTKFFTKNSPNRPKLNTMCTVCKIKPCNESSNFCSVECSQNHSNQRSDGPNIDAPGKIKTVYIIKKLTDPIPASAQDFMRSQLKNKSQDSNKATDFLFSNPVKINSQNSKALQESTKASVVMVKNQSPKVTPILNRHPSVNTAQKHVEKHKDEKSPQGKNTTEKTKAEQERKNVKKILAETLKARMQNFDHPEIPKMDHQQIEEFAAKVENEMFLFFNRDTREKYKTKYRSLKFNLGDVKNKTLIEKICSNKLTAKQLVQLSSADLASEDLAKWREHEHKHQLEIITKSELESLAQTKVVMKSHKGEEIIDAAAETKDFVMEDVELIISKTILKVERSEGGIFGENSGVTNSPEHLDSRHHRSRRSRSRSKDRHRKSSHSKHHRSRSRNHKTGNVSKSHDKSKKSSEHKRKRSKSRDKVSSKRHSDSSKDESSSHHHHHHHHKSQKKSEKHTEKKTTKIENELIVPEKEDVDLVGKILGSMGVHVNLERKEITPIVHVEEKNENEDADTIIIAKPSVAEINIPKEVHILRGNLAVPDVSSFNIVASKISGKLNDWTENTYQLDMIGRIEPRVVCDYVEKIKKSPWRELGLLRFSSEDTDSYKQTFDHLMSRKRFGVIKGEIPTIKDFYIFPLGKNDSLPNFLLPINGPGFIEGHKDKPDLLIGIVIRIIQDNRAKKPSSSAPYRKKTEKSVKHSAIGAAPLDVSDNRSKQKQSSILALGLPQLHSIPTDEAPLEPYDEPYEPYDEDLPSSRTQSISKPDDLKTKMELIDKQIQERKLEIQNLAQKNLLDLNEEEAKRIYENVQLPDNLTEILSKITSVDTTNILQTGSSHRLDEEYVPTAINNDIPRYTATASFPHTNINQNVVVNEMMDIDERVFPISQRFGSLQSSDQGRSILSGMTTSELLKLVPDDESI